MPRLIKQTLPQPPPVYDQQYIAKLAEAVNRYMFQAQALGEVTAARYIMTDPIQVPGDLPNTGGLPTGTVYLKQTPPLETGSVQAASVPATSSPTWVMAGLNFSFTMSVSTKAQFTMDGQMGNAVNNGQTDLTLVYGTGTPPAFGVAPPAGATVIGEPITFIATGGANSFSPFSRTVLITPLTPGTTYWIDIAVRTPVGTSILNNIALSGFGMFGHSGYFLTVVSQQDL